MPLLFSEPNTVVTNETSEQILSYCEIWYTHILYILKTLIFSILIFIRFNFF